MTEFGDFAHPYQVNLDLRAYAAGGFDRALFKATEGTGYVNPLFAPWWTLAGALGLARGAYHFGRPSAASPGISARVAHGTGRLGAGYRAWVDAGCPVATEADPAAAEHAQAGAQAEADHFAAVLQLTGVGARDWVVLDLEDVDSHHQPVPGARAWARAFTVRMVEHGYSGGIVYSYTPYLTAIGLAPTDLPAGWGWLHLANYAAIPVGALALPAVWDRYRLLARQYTDAAPTPGTPSPCDRSRVVREWISPEDDMPGPAAWTDADWKAVRDHVPQDVYNRFAWDVFVDAPGTEDPANPRPNQPSLGRLIRSDYNWRPIKPADVTAIKAGLAALLPAGHPALAALARQPGSIAPIVDDIAAIDSPAALARIAEAVTARLAQLATPPPVSPEENP